MVDVAVDVCDVCVIGGGLSGLVCALQLAEQKHRVVLLEASRDVGGRILAEELNVNESKTQIELGAAYCSQDHAKLLQLCQKFSAQVRFVITLCAAHTALNTYWLRLKS